MSSKLTIVGLLAIATPAYGQPAPPPPPTPAPADPAPGAAPDDPATPPLPAVPPAEAVATPPVAVAPVIEVPKHETKGKDEPPAKVTGAPGKGLTIKLGDAFSTNLRARIQPRWQVHGAPDVMGDRKFDQLVTINTARVWLSGNAFNPRLTYMLQLALAGRDYRDGAISPIFDAFIDYKATRELSVKAGQYFVPFDRLRTVRELALQLPERPRPVAELTLDRDVGVTLYSDHAFLGATSPLAWRVGVFGGGGTNLSTGKEPGVLLVARVEARPLGEIDDDSEGDLARRRRPGLALGAGIATNRNTNRQKSTTGATFTGGTTDYVHLALDATFKWRGFAAQLEYLRKTSSRASIPSLADPAVLEWTRAGSGFVVQASYVLDPPVEFVGRFTRIYAPGGTDPKLISEIRNLGQELAGGVNYYLNNHQLKFQAAWIIRSPRDFDLDSSDHLVVAHLDATF